MWHRTPDVTAASFAVTNASRQVSTYSITLHNLGIASFPWSLIPQSQSTEHKSEFQELVLCQPIPPLPYWKPALATNPS